MDDPVATFITRYKALGLDGTPASMEEVSALEQEMGLTLPAAYKAFLLILGRDGGPDFVGSDCTIRHLPCLRAGAEDLLRQCGSRYTLPEQALVYLMHQGYYFVYFLADGVSEDPPVFAYLEGDPAPVEKAESFSAWLKLATSRPAEHRSINQEAHEL
jgi:hypothetical protein